MNTEVESGTVEPTVPAQGARTAAQPAVEATQTENGVAAAATNEPPSLGGAGRQAGAAADRCSRWASAMPMPVQRAVFPRMMAGKDVMVQSRTGSGKTAAFGIPFAQGLIDPREEGSAGALPGADARAGAAGRQGVREDRRRQAARHPDLRRRADGQADRAAQGGRAGRRRYAGARARPSAARHAAPRRAEDPGARRGRRDVVDGLPRGDHRDHQAAARRIVRRCSSRRRSPTTSSASDRATCASRRRSRSRPTSSACTRSRTPTTW